MREPITHKRLGITEIDVRECNDRDELIFWRDEIQADITEMKNKLNLSKLVTETQGTHSDPAWIYRTNKCKSLYAVLFQRINTRLSQLKDDKIQAIGMQPAELFVNIAKSMIPGDLYAAIWSEVDDIIKTVEV